MIDIYLSLLKNEEMEKGKMMEERKKQQLAAQIAPLMDRIGRILIDLSPHLYSTAYTEIEQAENRIADKSDKIPLIDNPKDVSIVTNIIDRLLFAEIPRIELHIHASLNQQAFNSPDNSLTQVRNGNTRESNESNQREMTIQTEETRKSEIGIGTEVRYRHTQAQTETQRLALVNTGKINVTKKKAIVIPTYSLPKIVASVTGKQAMKGRIIRNDMNKKRRNINPLVSMLISPVAYTAKFKTDNPLRFHK